MMNVGTITSLLIMALYFRFCQSLTYLYCMLKIIGMVFLASCTSKTTSCPIYKQPIIN